MIRTSKVNWDDDEEQKKFAYWLMTADPLIRPSANEALKQLLQLKEKKIKGLTSQYTQERR